ncbi:MAG TPA: hypothetical protein VHT29_08435 [Solirubrobacteraceae bacterium]|nr:hypothetical protein [Solirubrobacteraceae bacterium]
MMLNGLPFFNAQANAKASGGSVIADGAFVALVFVLATCAFRTSNNTASRWAWIYGGAYLSWWVLQVVLGSPGVPVVAAAEYGREFMYFATLLPLLMLALRDQRTREGFIFVLCSGAALFSVGQIATQLGHPVEWLVHDSHINSFEGVSRVYAPMSDLVIALFPLALAASLLGPRRWRKHAGILALLTGVANILSFTRAVYLSESVAIAVVSVLWMNRGRIRAMIIACVCLMAVAVPLASGAASTSSVSGSPVQAVISRVSLAFSNLQQPSGTAALRLREDHVELQLLGGDWLTGLGFLSPRYRYFGDLPEGSIKDVDLGSVTILATAGLVGLLFAYVGPIVGLLYFLRRREGFVQYGGAIYLTAALIGSATLATFASVSGLLVLASVLAVCFNDPLQAKERSASATRRIAGVSSPLVGRGGLHFDEPVPAQ